ncbi:uncharacterized protein LOC117890064 isoform X1 [Drosophila subobscura]|uniref:uncharacterized protein LOC117890064 isoform X1 n=1 Tax=Drosophila subobscura TaxID=7241 RepID=UPI00155A8865|nr:uncharacterized protein LOC117890064 isoform X1 [Drosophila subobscura]
MSDDTYQIETRRRSRSKTPFLRSSCDHENCEHAGEEGHVHHQKKKSAQAPNVQTIIEESSVVVESSIGKKKRSKAFAQMTSDFSVDDIQPETKRKQSSTTTTTVTSTVSSKRMGGATSTPHNKVQLETKQNVLNTAQEQLNNSKRSNGLNRSGNPSDYLAYIEYKNAGEYWNNTPKTDYTYSELSPHRRHLAPGVVAMPNMSRRSLGNHDERVNFMIQQNPDQEELIRRRYQSRTTQQYVNYDSGDELDATMFGQQKKQSFWLVRLIQVVLSTVTTMWTRVTNISATETSAYQTYYARQQRQQERSLLGRCVHAIGDSLSRLLRYVYLFIGSVLSVDTWLLRSTNAENKSKKRFLLLLLILLPLLLLTAWSLLQGEQQLGYVQRVQALLPLPLTLLATWRGQLSSATATLKSMLQLPVAADEPAAIKSNLAGIEQSIKSALTAEEYENILNHINSYVQQLVELKLQQQAGKQREQQLSPQQVQFIVQLMKENLKEFSAKATLSEQELSDLASKLKVQLQSSGDWQPEARLSAANLEEITRLIKTEVNHHEAHYTLLLERIDLGALLERILGAPKLTEFVDERISLALQQQEQLKEGSGVQPTEHQLEQLNKEIAFIKLALSDNHAENVNLQQSLSSLQLGQEDLLVRMQQHELANDRRFSGLLAEIESKLAALNDSQFALLNKQIKLSLVEILGFKQSSSDDRELQLDDNELQHWVRSVFVAKDYLEQQLLELNERTNNNIREEIERSSSVLMSDISERLKREILLAVEAKHNESSTELKAEVGEEAVRQIVKSVLATYDADKTGMVDFALESAGGQILSTRCTESYQTKSAQISVFGIPLWYPTNTPRVAISPNVQPGECWAFQGFPGFLVLKLNSLVYVTGFTLEHIPKSLSPTGRIDSAPRNFTVWGLEHEKDQEPVLFGEYEYQDNGASLQYFALQNVDIQRPYEIVELRIETNHGQPTYTCLYRFRVHGKPSAT